MTARRSVLVPLLTLPLIETNSRLSGIPAGTVKR
nr:MAG TPA: hypothetical protein [Caudoviricetes sp.]